MIPSSTPSHPADVDICIIIKCIIRICEPIFINTTKVCNTTNLEKQDHALYESFEVVDIVETTFVLDVHEERHAENGKDEHNEEEQ